MNRINTETGEIQNYTKENEKIPDDSTSEVIKTQENKIVVATYSGICVYNEEKYAFESVLNTGNGLMSDIVYSLDEDKYGNIWVGTDMGVHKISKDFKILETYGGPKEENSVVRDAVYNMYCDDKYDTCLLYTSPSPRD